MLHDTYPVFFNFGEFRLISEGVASVSAVYHFKPGTKIQSDFCPRFFLFLFLAKLP